MKIDDIRVYVLDAEWKQWVIAVLETSDGVVGVGEGTPDYRGASVATAVSSAAKYLIGKSPFGVERHRVALYEGFFWRGGPAEMCALSAIDQALWDIAGKVAGLPVHQVAPRTRFSLGHPFDDVVGNCHQLHPLNQVERWFGLITQRAIRRGSFSSGKDLVQKIDHFVQHYTRQHRPFCLDCYGGFDSPENRTTLFTNFRDTILEAISKIPLASIQALENGQIRGYWKELCKFYLFLR